MLTFVVLVRCLEIVPAKDLLPQSRACRAPSLSTLSLAQQLRFRSCLVFDHRDPNTSRSSIRRTKYSTGLYYSSQRTEVDFASLLNSMPGNPFRP